MKDEIKREEFIFPPPLFFQARAVSTSALVLAASALRLRSSDGVDLPGSEGH
jgi:hypothetical protein